MARRRLIVRLRNWIGDVVLGVPLLQRLDDAGFDLQLVGKGWAADLLAGHGWRVEPLAGDLPGRVAQLRRLREQACHDDPGFDRRLNALVLPYSFSSALHLRLAGLRAVGHGSEGRSLLLSKAVDRRHDVHEMAVYADLGSALLGHGAPLPDRVALRTTAAHDEQAAAVRRQLGLRPGYVVICPFAGGTFDKLDKSWPLFPQWVASQLPLLGRDVLICPGPGDEETVAARDFAGCALARGVRLGTYAALLRDAALVVANDTGPGHVAAAVGAPLLSVLGPTDAARWGALGPTVQHLQQPGGWPTVDSVQAHARSLLRPIG